MKKVITYIILIAIVIGIVVFMNHLSEYSTPTSYNLAEIDDGVYLITYRVTSNVPAGNYDVAEYCINGNTYTVEGDVTIIYTDDTPSVSLSECKLVHGGKAIFYVPMSGVVREQSIGLR